MRLSSLIRTSANVKLREQLIQFFKSNPNPDDKQVHQLATRLKLSPHDLETHIYALLSELLAERA